MKNLLSAHTARPVGASQIIGALDDAGHRQWQREALELKVWRPKTSDPLEKGLAQLDAYLDSLALDTGVLVIFDRRPDAPPLTERMSLSQAQTPSGRAVTLLQA